ncbi:MAG: hypothetical protein QOH49_4645 [Acidobacteriota bacterium]|jgi:hypothetical protein|nr:hypothetical protein [Acidobacteriota bacterium]
MPSLSAPSSQREQARDGVRRGPVENYPTALRLLTPPKDESRGAALPVLATPGDLREAVQYLKRKPAGVSLVEALADARRRVFEPRKVAAYESWGLVARSGERLLLTRRGREFARTLEPETRAYRALLDSNPLYRAALAWIHREGLELVTYGDVAAYLKEEFGPLLASAGSKGAEEGIVCFFHLCQAAELGTLTIGKRGQPARMRVEREGLDEYVERRGAARAREGTDEPTEDDEDHGDPSSGTCLFITYGGQPAHVVTQIQTVFELAGIKSHASERAPHGGAAVLVADEAAEVMRRCDAALVLLSAEDCRPDESGAPAVSQRALVEIGAASVLYERRVLLLLDAPAELPAGLASLPHATLGEGGLTWEVGIELLKAVRGFANRAGRD